MYRQSSSRIQRSRGPKLKYILQICLLLAVCFWLIYQVKHSHDKKREFEELDSKASIQTEPNGEILNLGRKGIASSRDHAATSKPAEDDDIIEEDEENKPEDDGPEDKSDPEQDDHEQENPEDADVDDDVDLDDGGRGEIERESVRGEKESDRSTHEARDENYRADDASSAVDGNGSIGTSNEDQDNVPEESNMTNKTEETTGMFDQKSNTTKPENLAPPSDSIVEGLEAKPDLTRNGSAKVGRENRREQTHSSISNNSSNGVDSIPTGAESADNEDTKPHTNDENEISTNSTTSTETEDGKSQPDDSSNSDNNSNNTESFSSEKNAENSNGIELEKENSDYAESTGNEN